MRTLDGAIRRILHVYELSCDPKDLIRVRLARAHQARSLPDVLVLPGDPVLELHLWNEHVPRLPSAGADAGWAARILRRFRASLRAVADHLQSTPSLESVKALGATTILLGPDDVSLSLMKHLGFHVLPAARGPLGAFGEFWDNAYAWALVGAFNPVSLRRRSPLRLHRMEIWVSRQAFLRLYGRSRDHVDSTVAPALADG